MHPIILVALALLAGPAAAQDLTFDIAPTQSCLTAQGHDGNNRACIGRAAETCMDQPGGRSTVAMGFCLDRERGWWDDALNEAYQALMQDHRAADAGQPERLAIRAQTLREMQRAWIGYRDARCAHAASFWAGGTGAGPATINCLLHETGEQALYLRSLLPSER